MKNELVLDNYGVQEMTRVDSMETDGGFLPLIAAGVELLGVAAGWACGAIAGDIIMNWDSAVKAVEDGYKKTRRPPES